MKNYMRSTQYREFSTWTGSIWAESSEETKKLELIDERILYFVSKTREDTVKHLVRKGMTWFWLFQNANVKNTSRLNQWVSDSETELNESKFTNSDEK